MGIIKIRFKKMLVNGDIYMDVRKHRNVWLKDAILAPEDLDRHAAELARNHPVRKSAKSLQWLLRRINSNYGFITEAYMELNRTAGGMYPGTPAVEWLLDNFYIIEEQFKIIRRSLAKGHYSRLPVLKGGYLKGYPRVYAISLELIAHTDGRIDEKTLAGFINSYQVHTPLSMGELWALALMLRIALLENMGNICEDMLLSQREYQRAEKLAATVPTAGTENGLIMESIHNEIHSMEEISPSFTEHLLQCLRKQGKALSEVTFALDSRLEEDNLSSEMLTAFEHQQQAGRQVSIGNTVTGLRLVSDIDWSDIFESLSHVELILRKDPAGIYADMDFESRDYYRHEVEKLARKFNTTEINVAKKAVQFAVDNPDGGLDINKAVYAANHVGYYLAGKGNGILAAKLDNTKSKEGLTVSSTNKRPFVFYLIAISALTAFLTSYFTYYSSIMSSGRITLALLTAILVLLPCSELSITFTNNILSHLFKPSILPKLELKMGIPSEMRTMVIIPALLTSEKRVSELLDQLEQMYLGNRERNLSFALLGDFRDHDGQEAPEDGAITAIGLSGIKVLNERYSKDGSPIFHYMHRERRFNATQGRWTGWERKRGSIVEFNRLIRGDRDTGYVILSHKPAELPKVKYVITLDADTCLPMGTAKRLIGTMAHPLNHPHIDNDRRIVTDGYGLLQPRINISIPGAGKSLYTRIFAGQGGIDPYTTAVSDIYQDVFKEGIFTGKGIYDLDVFLEVLDKRLPEGAILSHDLIEGCHLRAGLVSDIELVDGYPARYNSNSMRVHRWVRGDWQLLPWLTSKVRTGEGSFSENPLLTVSKWKIFDNLRRSLIMPALLLLMLGGVSVLPGSFLIWTGLAVATTAVPLLSYIMNAVIAGHFKTAGNSRSSTVITGIKAGVYQSILLFSFLPHQAFLMVDAAGRTLVRLLTRKNLLEWVTAADAEAASKNDFKGFAAKMWIVYPVSILIIVLAASRPYAIAAALPSAALWVLSPLIAYLVSRPFEHKQVKLSLEDLERLRLLAQKTWRFFEDFALEEDNYLPPDNYQEDPPRGAAHRTSPTNIGLLLISVQSAYDLGLLDANGFIGRVERIISTVEKMEKWKGHLYNWYNTITLRTMRPLYVSTVDSGNLVGCLMTLREGLLELEPEDTIQTALIKDLAERVRVLIDNTEFRPLFDSRRQLFSIGFNAEDGHLSKSYYDLLASEARQASYIAIARGEVELRHWFRLGRKLTADDGFKGLVSWTGTMFEYLMPLLLMKNFENTILDETYSFVVRMQKKHAQQKKIPWGISEAGFNAFDINLNYQYKAFGIPELGFRRGLGNDTVVAPYASIIAVSLDPSGVLANLAELEKKGMAGEYGFYEAIDFTPSRLDRNDEGSIVKSYMAHHQGMSLAALNNFLNNNILQARFHRIPVIRSAELLLQEKSPEKSIFTREFRDETVYSVRRAEKEEEETVRIYGLPDRQTPSVHLISNGGYSIMLTDGGAGYSKYGDLAVSRWTGDNMSESCGMFIYIQNINSNNAWSAAFEPVRAEPDKYTAVFAPDKAKYERRDGNIETSMEITVSPEDNAEIRTVSLTNHSEYARVLEVTSYMEVVLAAPEDDASHPAFSKLFVRTEFVRERSCILANRRSRKEDGRPVWLMHTMAVDGEVLGDIQLETDRLKFIGRNRDLSSPAAMDPDQPLSNSVGAILDPVVSLRRRIRLKSGETGRISFISAVAETRKNALELAEKYRELQASDRAFELSWTRSQVENRYLGNKSADIELFLNTANQLLYYSPLRTAAAEMILKNTSGQQELWPMGISGDLPILLAIIRSREEAELALFGLKAHEYWRMKGLTVDLVIVIENEYGYIQPLKELIRDNAASVARELLDRRGGVFIKSREELEEDQFILLNTAARVVWKNSIQEIRDNTERVTGEGSGEAGRKHGHIRTGGDMSGSANCLCDDLTRGLAFFNGTGGFDNEGREYVIRLEKGKNTPAPWINVISNENFGFLVSESGGGYTWSVNSRENKLTGWSNDPVMDVPREIVYIRDEISGEFWSITPQPVRGDGVYTATHGFGYSVFEHSGYGLEQSLTMFAAGNAAVKIMAVKIRNTGNAQRVISLTYYLRPVLGVSELKTAPFIVTSIDSETGMLLIENKFGGEFKGRVAYVDASIAERSFTGDRWEFFGPGGSLDEPCAMTLPGNLGGTVGAGLDPCAALQVKVELKPGDEKTVIFLFGQEESSEKALETALRFREPEKAMKELERVKRFWEEKLESVRVNTPDESFDIIMNGWLLYQVIVCRLWARSAFYQSGGAYGFRDQLQDSMASLLMWPELARRQILLHASRQFPEGDVQHWWHMGTGRGIRTKYSDDLLWLPYVTAEYIEKTGDWEILGEEVAFIDAPALGKNEDERYDIPVKLEKTTSLYDHCCLAIDISLRFGIHGIPLMGSGDWNDGMNTVGNGGRGESLWLGWFLSSVLKKFMPICSVKEDISRYERYGTAAEDIIKSIEKEGWDGSWYRRAYFDDGTPLGSAQNCECKIDSIAQSWSVISGAAKHDRMKEAMGAVEKYLVDREEGIIKLLAPPFDDGVLKPGYIKGYVPGVRENGGQYTHAAAWVVLAFAKLGMGNMAWELFDLINPVNHARSPMELNRYKTEPYVVAADVYAVPPNAGRGGWTWYTGAAGWIYRTGIEDLLGFKKIGDKLVFDPCIPEAWRGFEMKYRFGKSTYIIQVYNPEATGKGVKTVKSDCGECSNGEVLLIDDGKDHLVEVFLGKKEP